MYKGMGVSKKKLDIVQKEVGEFDNATNKAQSNGDIVRPEEGEFTQGMHANIPMLPEEGEFMMGDKMQKSGKVR